MLRAIANRVYSDFLMPSRLDEYRNFLLSALGEVYRIVSIRDFFREPVATNSDKQILVLRHDIDTDPATARKMWEIESSLGITSSYYFRLGTIDVELMKQIEAGGGEVGYHYEEIGTLAKQFGWKSKEEVIEAFPAVRELFKSNLMRLRELTGLPLTVVASHGDFANRKLGMSNYAFLTDHDFRSSTGVELEVYDSLLVSRIALRISDAPFPLLWSTDPLQHFRQKVSPLQLLIHPRQWHASLLSNLSENAVRIFEGAKYFVS